MQLCSALEVVHEVTTAADCRAFAQGRGELEGVTTQISISSAVTESTTGYCVWNSGSSGKWQIIATNNVNTALCDGNVAADSTACGCVPRPDYVTLGEQAAISSVQLYFDTNAKGQLYDAQTCCELCSQVAPPSAPPLPPPASLQSPSTPPIPPIPPNPPPPPPTPLLPPGTVVSSSAPSTTFNPFAPTICRGIVIDDNNVCHLMKDSVPLEHDGSSTTYIKGRTSYYWSSPPPPPHYPSMAACAGFRHHIHETIASGTLYGYSELTVADIDGT